MIKTITEVLSDEISSAINDNITCIDLGGGNLSPEYISPDDIDKIVSEVIAGILNNKEIEIRFKEISND